MKQAKKQGDNREALTTGEALALEIARLFPDEFRIWGDRVSVKENVGRESTRREVSANLAEMYAAADADRKAKSRTKQKTRGKREKH